MENGCPVCHSNCSSILSGFEGGKYDCQRCGEFRISGAATGIWLSSNPADRQIANTSGWIREHQNYFIDEADIKTILSLPSPTVPERATKLLKAMEEKSERLGSQFDINKINMFEWLSISYSTGEEELSYLFRTYLVDEKQFVSSQSAIGPIIHHAQITPKGYAYLDSLKHSFSTSQIGFCAMWFDAELTSIWTNAISPAIKDAGYDPKRIDSHQHNNKIDDEIIAMIRRSKFIVADFTGQRGGVYFEAGFALGLGLPVIWTCEKSELKDVHFDNRQYNFVQWEKGKLPEFKKGLQSRIEATLGRGTLV